MIRPVGESPVSCNFAPQLQRVACEVVFSETSPILLATPKNSLDALRTLPGWLMSSGRPTGNRSHVNIDLVGNLLLEELEVQTALADMVA